jgi:F-type H+-transporting ATPase subunit epsilon
MADLPNKLNLTVVTRDRKIIDVAVDEVVLPGSDGEIGILPGHTPLLASLRIGQFRYRVGNTMYRMVLTWGFAEVLPDRVIVLAENARLPEEIDPAAAAADRAAAEKDIADLSSHDPEFAMAEAKLEQAMAELDLHHTHRS